MKIWGADVLEKESGQPCGTVAEVTKESFLVQTGKGLLAVRQPADPGKEAYGRGRLPERLPGGAGDKAWRRRNGRINKKVLNLYEKQVGSLFFVYNTPLGG